MCPVWPTQREPVPDNYSSVDPEHKLIYRFVRTLFSAAQLTAECAIVTLVSVTSPHHQSLINQLLILILQIGLFQSGGCQ